TTTPFGSGVVVVGAPLAPRSRSWIAETCSDSASSFAAIVVMVGRAAIRRGAFAFDVVFALLRFGSGSTLFFTFDLRVAAPAPVFGLAIAPPHGGRSLYQWGDPHGTVERAAPRRSAGTPYGG